VSLLKDPEKLEEFERQQGIDSGFDDLELVTSVNDLMGMASMAADDHQDTIDAHEGQYKRIQEEIRNARVFLDFVSDQNYEKVAELLQAQATFLRAGAEDIESKVGPIARALGNDCEKAYARRGTPRWRIEAELLDHYAKMLLIGDSP
jgi:hypothetical protein